MGLEQEFDDQHLQNIMRLIGNMRSTGTPSAGRIARTMNQAADTLARDVARFKLRHPPSTCSGRFYALNKRLAQQISDTLAALSDSIRSDITQEMESQWKLANTKNNALTKTFTSGVDIPEALYHTLHQFNHGAMNAFIARVEDGMSLSKRVWDIAVPNNKDKLEMYLSSGITTGRSADKISQDIRELLVEPKKLFRRIRDPKTGELVFSKSAKAFHPGQGMYRSSYKNAMRLAGSESNMAYRLSDSFRRRQLPFVHGVRVHLSDSHPRLDICDSMIGDYPAGFVFLGWHPMCFCYTTSILAKKEEFVRFVKTRHIDARKEIRSIPKKAQRYIAKHGPTMQKWKNKPYFLKDNFTKDLNLRKNVLNRDVKAEREIAISK